MLASIHTQAVCALFPMHSAAGSMYAIHQTGAPDWKHSLLSSEAHLACNQRSAPLLLTHIHLGQDCANDERWGEKWILLIL